MLMQPLDSLGPKFPNSGRILEMGPVTSATEEQDHVAQAPLGNAQDLNGRSRLAYCGGLPTTSNLSNLAVTYWHQGQWTDAEALEVQVLEARKKILGQEHPFTLTSMNNLASTYCHHGRWTEAEVLQVQGQEVRKKVLGQEHPNRLQIMAQLAHTWHDQGDNNKVLQLMSKCVELQKNKLGVDHPNPVQSIGIVNKWQ